MRFFFLAKEKKRSALNDKQYRALFFGSLDVSLSLSLSLFVRVIFEEGERERLLKIAAVLLLEFCRLAARGRVVLVSLLFLFASLSSVFVYLLKESEEEKKRTKRKRPKKTRLFFFFFRFFFSHNFFFE